MFKIAGSNFAALIQIKERNFFPYCKFRIGGEGPADRCNPAS